MDGAGGAEQRRRAVPDGPLAESGAVVVGHHRRSEEADLYPVVFSASGPVRYRAGSTTDANWFGTVARPRINGSVQPPTRTGDRIDVIVPAWGDSGGSHANYAAFGSGTATEKTELYRSGTLLADGSSDVTATVPGKKGTYRLVHSATREATAEFPYSTSTRTEWTFTSAVPRGAQETEQLPLIQLDYTLPTSAAGGATPGATLFVTPLHLAGGPHDALRTTKVELSYDDGATWTTARLAGRGDGTVGRGTEGAEVGAVRHAAGAGRGQPRQHRHADRGTGRGHRPMSCE
ncbi:hypothetical protein OG243_11535 [Streptomyces sp. NBC_01318]|uniref:hypothetical protein n=1 Tax=Streptomyces sp. NBC_01318 TaxID=2903823 RepID=UPI002E1335F0|nr:hypothetical protein OG243_11535 [Streptomyces sp. NBC_01318]